ncbi:DUF4139 domain-containing protein [Mesoterricola silvestris]|uniref:DUF4139 domain-containing protein n=1 Tax=Mesoterricola silvestris TaxID=2927979 RepID=A0AA48GR45_9BACT|nr:DUF4139 domain-containing protein [Mesoterricola silvestris]BDU74170.1 hypothetical protein METEAL_33440 [Mesoterricola silvestris]
MRPAVLSLLALCLSAQEPSLTPALNRVRVHPSQAWTTRETTWTFKAPGSQRVRLIGLPPGLSLGDVRVQADGIPGLRLGNVVVIQEEGHYEPDATARALSTEGDRLEKAQLDLTLRLEALEEARTSIQGLKPDVGPGPVGPLQEPKVSVELERAIQSRGDEILTQVNAIKAEQKTAQARQEAILAELARLEAASKRASSVVTVELEAPSAGEARVQIHSHTGAARWRPGFEVRLGEKGLELLCYASVSQASGEDWRGVNLEISNAEPGRALKVPAPPPAVQVLYEAPGVVLTGRIEGKVTDRMGRAVPGVRVEATNAPLKASRATTTDANGVFRIPLLPPGEYTLRATKTGYPTAASYARVNAGQATSLGLQMVSIAGASVVEVVAEVPGVDRTAAMTASSFSTDSIQALESTPDHYEDSGELSRAWILEGKRDLASDAVSRRILLARASVDPKLLLKALPRSSTEVFLIAPLPAPSGFPWFPGTPTAVFRNGEQLGQVSLPRLQGTEGALFSFGPVPGLRVQRQRLEATVASARGGRGRQWTLRERVLLVNDLDKEVEVEVQEPSIRSGSEKVKVEVLPEATPALEAGDKMTWTVKVPAHGQAKIEEAWRITGPTAGSVPEVALLGLPTSD